MIPLSRRTLAVIFFTLLLIALVNFSWWLFYDRTESSFENQLSRRLSSIAHLGASAFSPELINSLLGGSLSAYDSTLNIIDYIRDSDSLSEVFVITPDYSYLATTLLSADSNYYLGALNGRYIDSALDQPGGLPVVTDGYRVGDIFLRSAFVPLTDTSGLPAAVLGVEADVDYTDDLLNLRRNLYLSTAISIGAGLLFGFFFFLIQRRINASEQSVFMAQSQANLGRMVAVVSHEIKNPLMIIRASAERLKKSSVTLEAGFILEETDRLNGIVTGYLDFSTGRKTLKIETVNLNDIVRKIIEQFTPRFSHEKISLTLTPCPGVLLVSADPSALRQVIINLIFNAADAVRGKENGTIIVGCESQNGRALTSVTDNGPGMNRKALKSLFEPFYTTKTTGSGLGLFLSRRLVTEMSGEISAQSKPGGPTIFAVALPEADNKMSPK